MGCFPVAAGPTAYLRSREHLVRHDSTDPLHAMGGRIRNWPLTPPGFHLTLEQSAELEIRRAMRIGIDGFAVDAWAGRLDAKRVLDAMFRVAERHRWPFKLTICLDPNCRPTYARTHKPDDLFRDFRDSIRRLLDRHGNSPNLARRDGKPLIFGYHSAALGRAYVGAAGMGDPSGWHVIGEQYRRLEQAVGQPLYLHFGLGAFFHGVDLHELPGARPPHQPGVWIVRAGAAMGRDFPAVGAFLDTLFEPELDSLAAAVKRTGAEWSQPLWHQYENIRHQLWTGKGTEILRDRWERARRTGSTLIQYVTWNDYGENTNLAPGVQTRYTIYDLNGWFIRWWKTGRPPETDHDRVYLISRKYPRSARTFPFRARRYAPGVIEVITILPEPAVVELLGRDLRYEAPRGFYVKQLPLTPGPVVAVLFRNGREVLRLEHPDPVTDRPFREDNAFTCFSTEFERHWKEDFGEAPLETYSETGDVDGDGLPNWFEMYWFGKFGDWSTAACADPDQDPDADGASNLDEYLDQTNPTRPPPRYKPGDVWDMRVVYRRNVTYNPDPDFNNMPVWEYRYKIGKPPIPCDGKYESCPCGGDDAAYAGRLVHHAPWPGSIPGYDNAYGWISRKPSRLDGSWDLVLQPAAQCMMVLGWRSPVDGVVDVRAEFANVGNHGARVRVEHSRPHRTLVKADLPPGKTVPVRVDGLNVRRGEALWFTAAAAAGAPNAEVRLRGLRVSLRKVRYAALLTVHSARPVAPVNPRVLGVCLMHPPFHGEESVIHEVFGGASVRVWAREKVDWWDGLASGLRAVEPCFTMAFVDKSWHPEKVMYQGPESTNLFAWQKPDAVVRRVRFALAQLKRLGVETDGPLHWEVWNEPQFAENGGWEPEALARYANDCARALKDAGLPVKVGVPLHMNDDAWNRRLCRALDPERIDFLVNHYYNVGWHKLRRPRDEFLRRAGYGPVLRQRVRRDQALVRRFGRGRWTLHCSEWNVHPPAYKPPFHTSCDMAAALYAFSAVRIYLEERVDSAQFFLLSTKDDAHFAAMVGGDGKAPRLRPTGEALRLLRRHLRGRLVAVDVQCPVFVRDGQLADASTVAAPYLEVMACCERENGPVTLLMANKDPVRWASVRVTGVAIPAGERAVVLTGAGEHREKACVEKTILTVQDGAVELPPASIVIVTVGG